MTPLGVVIFGRHDAGSPFTAGDRKLVIAVAAQLGTALHNASLMRAAVEREQFAREMRLAHDLQLKLLPDPRVVGPEARAAARVIPAESVGGDFFLLARLDAHRTGVLVGDVSGHGYQAALVMALALSAAAIHIRAAADPAETLHAVAQSLQDELESTEMSLSLCYVIIDEAHGVVRYANAGHPHMFHQSCDGTLRRLTAQSLPLGFGAEPQEGGTVPWQRGDRIIGFTDGVIDAQDPREHRLGERAVLEVLAGLSPGDSPDDALARIFEMVATHRDGSTLHDDLTVVVVDREGVRP
jgi:phosphoserine phosphatase RsbU/P